MKERRFHVESLMTRRIIELLHGRRKKLEVGREKPEQ
jgi:hypothetical protein